MPEALFNLKFNGEINRVPIQKERLGKIVFDMVESLTPTI